MAAAEAELQPQPVLEEEQLQQDVSNPITVGQAVSQAKSLRVRTDDVLAADKTFRDLGLPEATVKALAMCGFDRPSPVQQAAIPLGRLGSDLIVQAKSGTGKTVVFTIICLERVKMDLNLTQALILAPTREIAIQSEQVISRVAAALPPPCVTCAVFVGGLPQVNDEKRLRRLCHIAVGTPGRLTALIQAESLKCDSISMFVLDEADALLGESFYADVTWIYDQLPRRRKQVMAFSATYTPELLQDLEPLMKRPQQVMLCEETVSLKGVRQFYQLVDEPESRGGATEQAAVQLSPTAVLQRKAAALQALLSQCSFHQASVFCNQKQQAEWLARMLTASGFPAVYLAADVAQADRQRLMQEFREFKARVVVSTDVLARGVDLERVNLVVNLDLPRDSATFVHRVGRTGRFGTRGVSVCMVGAAELVQLKVYLAEVGGGEAEPLPAELPPDLYAYDLGSDWERAAAGALAAAPVGPAPDLPTTGKEAKALPDNLDVQGEVADRSADVGGGGGDGGEDPSASAYGDPAAWQAYGDAWAAYHSSNPQPGSSAQHQESSQATKDAWAAYHSSNPQPGSSAQQQESNQATKDTWAAYYGSGDQLPDSSQTVEDAWAAYYGECAQQPETSQAVEDAWAAYYESAQQPVSSQAALDTYYGSAHQQPDRSQSTRDAWAAYYGHVQEQRTNSHPHPPPLQPGYGDRDHFPHPFSQQPHTPPYHHDGHGQPTHHPHMPERPRPHHPHGHYHPHPHHPHSHHTPEHPHPYPHHPHGHHTPEQPHPHHTTAHGHHMPEPPHHHPHGHHVPEPPYLQASSWQEWYEYCNQNVQPGPEAAAAETATVGLKDAVDGRSAPVGRTVSAVEAGTVGTVVLGTGLSFEPVVAATATEGHGSPHFEGEEGQSRRPSRTDLSEEIDLPSDDELEGHAAALLEGLDVQLAGLGMQLPDGPCPPSAADVRGAAGAATGAPAAATPVVAFADNTAYRAPGMAASAHWDARPAYTAAGVPGPHPYPYPAHPHRMMELPFQGSGGYGPGGHRSGGHGPSGYGSNGAYDWGRHEPGPCRHGPGGHGHGGYTPGGHRHGGIEHGMGEHQPGGHRHGEYDFGQSTYGPGTAHGRAGYGHAEYDEGWGHPRPSTQQWAACQLQQFYKQYNSWLGQYNAWCRQYGAGSH